ncbi:hypothetical protein DNTS_023939, partial [Danionella cerebrum]
TCNYCPPTVRTHTKYRQYPDLRKEEFPLKELPVHVLLADMEREDSPVKELDLGRLEFFGHLERVERMRCYWELKHIQIKTLEKSLARVYDPKPLHAQKRSNAARAAARKASFPASNKHQASTVPEKPPAKSSLVNIEGQVNDLSGKMDKLLALQQASLKQLDAIGHNQGSGAPSVEQVLCDVRVVIETAREKEKQQDQRLDSLERLVSSIQQVVSFVAEVLKQSRLTDLLRSKRSKSSSRYREKDGKEKTKVYSKGLKTQKKKKPLDISDQAGLEEVEKLNQQNNQLSQCPAETATSTSARLELIEEEKIPDKYSEIKDDAKPAEVEGEQESLAEVPQAEEEERIDEMEDVEITEESKIPAVESRGQTEESIPLTPSESVEENLEITLSTKRHVIEETLTDDLKKSRVEETEEEKEFKEEEEVLPKTAEAGPEGPEEDLPVEEESKEAEPLTDEYVIDSSPPPPAPFEHRLVATKSHQINSFYDINKEEVLGGGRFGMVHKCVEKSSGLVLAAKIIKARSQKEKEVVKCEIEVMNQLNHANLIQLYAAFESRHEVILVMDVDGGELFDRIIDENYKLTELDTVLFIRQISEGLQYMHKMYILHLDLKPENILCVSRETNKVKIIDFGLARRYKPREKLRVNFGTPEFLAPEVINYEFVSFPTDMWSLGVITYMLLSGLSPFLGEDDNETLNNILACQWSFEEAEFTDISEEAKDFITRLLVKSKGWRMSASQSLKHPWLSDRALHYRLNLKQNKCHSSHAPAQEKVITCCAGAGVKNWTNSVVSEQLLPLILVIESPHVLYKAYIPQP